MKTPTKNTTLSITNNRKVKVFLFILILTSIIWVLIELSKSSTSSVVFNVEYKNIPTGKLLQSKPVSEINLTLKAPGFSLLKYKLRKHKIAINLRSVTKNNLNYYILPNQQLSYLNSQLPGETEIIRVLNDTIFIELGKNKTKKVPIHPTVEIKFKLGYNLTEAIKVIPDSVLVTGPEKYVDSIEKFTTEIFKKHDVYEDINEDLVVKLPAEKTNLKIPIKKVRIIGRVDKFTEGKFTIPVILINKPAAIKVSTFPKEIEVIYQADLSNFNKITKNSFRVVYDFEEYTNDTLIKYLTPVIKQKSEFISSIKINPAQLEFLIQK